MVVAGEAASLKEDVALPPTLVRSLFPPDLKVGSHLLSRSSSPEGFLGGIGLQAQVAKEGQGVSIVAQQTVDTCISSQCL